MISERLRIAAKINRTVDEGGQPVLRATIPMGVLFEKALDPAQVEAERARLEESYRQLVGRLQVLRAGMKSGTALDYWDFGDAIAHFESEQRESLLFVDGLVKHLERDIPFSETMILLCRRFRERIPDRSQVDPVISFTRYHRSGFDLARVQAPRRAKRERAKS